MNDFFKVLADETRLRCIMLIFIQKELCVCELIYSLKLPQSKISRHLSLMKLHKIVHQRREGQWVFYSLHPDISTFKKNILELINQQVQTELIFTQDLDRLSMMKNRPDSQKRDNLCLTC